MVLGHNAWGPSVLGFPLRVGPAVGFDFPLQLHNPRVARPCIFARAGRGAADRFCFEPMLRFCRPYGTRFHFSTWTQD